MENIGTIRLAGPALERIRSADLLLAANGDLMGLTGGRLMLEYHGVNHARVVLAYLMHLSMVGRAEDGEWAGEQQRCEAYYNN